MKRLLYKILIYILVVTSVIALILSGYYHVEALENDENKVTIVSENSNGSTGIFNNSDGFWYPGKTLKKKFIIKNRNNSEVNFYRIAVNIQSIDSFILKKFSNPDQVIYKEFLQNLKVQLKDGNNVIFDGTFETFNSKGASLISSIKVGANSEKELWISLHLEETSGNIFQNIHSLFNLNIQYIIRNNVVNGKPQVKAGKIVDKITNY